MDTMLISRRGQRRELGRWVAASALSAGAAGATAMYFLDPDRGRSRRANARDRLAALVRATFRNLGRGSRGVAADAYGIAQQAQHMEPEHWSVPNDVTLAQRVESELFRDADIPKGQININAEAGIVVLRGELDQPDQIRSIEDRVKRLPGVRGVHNLLHERGTRAPDCGSVFPAS